MTKCPRNTQPDPSPASEEPRGDQAQKPSAPGASFYPAAMNTRARKKFARARKVQGLNDEIALLRLRLRDLLAKKYPHKHPRADQTADQTVDQASNKPSDPALDRTIDRTIEVIVRAYAARTRVSKDSPDDAAKGVATVLKDVALDLGMDVIPWRD